MAHGAFDSRLHQRLSRRRVLGGGLALAAGAVLIACGDGGADPPSAAEDETAPNDDAARATSTDDPSTASDDALVSEAPAQIGPGQDGDTLEEEPVLFISPRNIRQGESFVVAVDAPGGGFGSVAFNGQFISLLHEGDRFFTILGVDALTPPGPLPVVISIADAQGRPAVRRETLVTVTDAQWQIEVVELDESNSDLLNPLIIAEDQAVRQPVLTVETPERHWDGIFDPPSTGVITSTYGLLRSYNLRAPEEYHTGLDFGADSGAPILAPNAGVVAWIGQTRRRGNGVIIDHGGGVFTGYYHMSEVFAEPGQVVNTGDFLGRVGATGLATGPHLHWEVVIHGVTVDPVQWIRILDFPDPLEEFDPADAVVGPNQLSG